MRITDPRQHLRRPALQRRHVSRLHRTPGFHRAHQGCQEGRSHCLEYCWRLWGEKNRIKLTDVWEVLILQGFNDFFKTSAEIYKQLIKDGKWEEIKPGYTPVMIQLNSDEIFFFSSKDGKHALRRRWIYHNHSIRLTLPLEMFSTDNE